MAARKRTKMQREKDLVLTAEMYLKGSTQMAIAKEIGVSQAQISLDLKELVGRWKDKAEMAINERKAEELAKVDQLEMEYWTAWAASCKPTKISTSQATTAGANPGKTVSKKEVTSAGDPRFLQGVAQCIEMRCRILGLHAPTKLQATITEEHDYSEKEIKSIAAELARRKN